MQTIDPPESEPAESTPFDLPEALTTLKPKKPRVRKTLVSVMENKLSDIEYMSKQFAELNSKIQTTTQKSDTEFEKFKDLTIKQIAGIEAKLKYLYEEFKDLRSDLAIMRKH